jgi:hypothetical protein
MDIALALSAAVIQMLTAFVGYRAAGTDTDTPKANPKASFAKIFLILGILGALLSLLGAYRAKESGEELGVLMQALNSNTGRPEIRGDVHTDQVVRLTAGQKIAVDITHLNYGSQEAKNIKIYYAIQFSQRSKSDGIDEAVHEQLRNDILAKVLNDKPDQTISSTPPKGQVHIHAISNWDLSQDQYRSLRNHKGTIYVGVVFYYKAAIFEYNHALGHYWSHDCDVDDVDFKSPDHCDLEYEEFHQFVRRP